MRIVYEDQRQTTGIESIYIIVTAKDFLKELTKLLDEVYGGITGSSGVKENRTAKGYRGIVQRNLQPIP